MSRTYPRGDMYYFDKCQPDLNQDVATGKQIP